MSTTAQFICSEVREKLTYRVRVFQREKPEEVKRERK
jgi:hypothetical protein